MSSTARSKKTKTKNKPQTYTVTLEVMTPVQCTFEIEADSPEEAIEAALRLDWDDPQNVGPDGDSPTYCVGLSNAAGKELAVPPKYSFDTVNKENN